MKQARLRFYGELNDFVDPDRRQVSFVHTFTDRVAVKDVIESHGVPHTEVDLLLVNGESRPFSSLLEDGDLVSAYPPFRAFDVGSLSLVRAPRPAEFRFVVDTHLGRLAAYLRMAGFDAVYRNDWPDSALAQSSAAEDRVLLTRDIALLKRAIVRYGYYVRETAPRRQFVEILRQFDLVALVRPFARCLRCNGSVESCPREAVADRLPPRSGAHYREFWMCTGCGRVYWKGSHYERMRAFIGRILEEAGAKGGP